MFGCKLQVYFWSLPSCAGNQVKEIIRIMIWNYLNVHINFYFQKISWLYSYQLRNVYRKLESDLQNSKNRLEELTEQCKQLKKGREESVSICILNER